MNKTIKGATLILLFLAATLGMSQNIRHLQTSVSKLDSHLLYVTQSQGASTKPQVSPGTSTNSDNLVEQQIVGYIYSKQHGKGMEYAKKIGKYIVDAAKEFHIDPYMLATTADIESSYDMKSRPQIGIMQFTRSTGKTYIKMGLNIYEPRDNIRAGACKLSYHYYELNNRNRKLPSRGALPRLGRNPGRWEPSHGKMDDSKLRYMWGRYNGCGSSGGYVKKSISRYNTIRNWTGVKSKAKTKKH